MRAARITRAFVVTWIALLVPLACSTKAARGGDSNTNWLRTCDNASDCGGLDCICGFCTKACSGSSCGSGPATECIEPSDSATEMACRGVRPMTPLCTSRCAHDADCAAAGANLRCIDGACYATRAELRDAAPSNLPDVVCQGGRDFPEFMDASGTTTLPGFFPCNCVHASPRPGDDYNSAAACGTGARVQLLSCGHYLGVLSSYTDFGSLDFYDSNGQPVGSFNYGTRDTCVAYTADFIGLPSPCFGLETRCDGGS